MMRKKFGVVKKEFLGLLPCHGPDLAYPRLQISVGRRGRSSQMTPNAPLTAQRAWKRPTEGTLSLWLDQTWMDCATCVASGPADC